MFVVAFVANMARTHSRVPRGGRLRAPVPFGHWKATTFVGALRRSGLVAPMVLDGPINLDAFEAYVEQVLVPDLGPSDVVIMDNLQPQRSARPRADRGRRRDPALSFAARLREGRLYRPDFNPIEKAFSKLKAMLREAAERTVDALWNAIGRLIDLFTPAECDNYFAACGYNAA